MASIKGITVKIGGDTTQLTSALKGVNDTIKITESKLKDVNKALKFDPSNTELLKQKQELLANSIDATKKKIETMRAAQQQAAADMANGVAGAKEKYDALTIEISKASSNLKSLESQSKKTDDAVEGVGDTNMADNLTEQSSKVSGAMSAIGTAAAAAAVAVAAAVASVVKSAVESYANYEQLVGGVETLFGAGGASIEDYAASVGKTVDEVRSKYDSLMAAQETVANNAAEAYKNAGMSANEYMETVTSFSASLIQSLGGDTEKAAKVADVAITDMSDNANKMGTDLQSIQVAYQGFAKQNYTMLDNLKLGYGGTKEEMQRLIKHANELKKAQGEVGDLTIESYANVIEAIHLVQTEIGITGTTALEASTTIQGSVNSVKAAWQNMLVGLADDSADFGTLIDNLVSSASTALNNIMPRIKTALAGVSKLVTGIAPIIIEQLPALFEAIVPGLISSIVSLLPTILETVITLAQSLATSLVDNLPALLETLTIGLIAQLPTLIETLVQMVAELAVSLSDPGTLSSIMDAAINIVMALADGLIKAIPTLIEAIPTIISNILMSFTENAPKLLEMGITLLLKLAKGLIQAIPQLVAQIPQIITGIVNAIKNGFSRIVQVGRNIVEGLWQGISGAASWLWNKISGWLGGVWDGILSFLGIASPSKKMKWVGKMMTEGMALGIKQGGDEVLKSALGLSADLAYTFGNLSFTPTINNQNDIYLDSMPIASQVNRVLGAQI